MDVICKCGHKYSQHALFNMSGCLDVGLDKGGNCKCGLSQSDVLIIFITEQQARLDTNRQQNVVMAKKIKKQNNKIDFMFSELFRISSGHGLYDENDMIEIARETLDRVGRNV